MNITKESNTVNMNGKKISFDYHVETILEFSQYCVVLLMDDTIPDNNVEAIDYDGNIVWNISQIIKFEYPESYISLSMETETLFSLVSYSGVKFVIDTKTNQVVTQMITK